MNRNRISAAVTIAILAGLLATAVVRRKSERVITAVTPQDAIYQMMDAARAGDIAAYLDHYTGRMESDLRQTLQEKTPAGFRRYLQSSNAEIKGVAISEPKQLSGNEVELRVEYVYGDRNEVQRVVLEKTGTLWKISRVDGAERVKTLVPYGAPVE